MTNSPTTYRGIERHNQPNQHSLPQIISISRCTIEALHRPGCDLVSPSPLNYKGTAISSPMSHDYPSQKLEFLEKGHRSESAGCAPSAWTAASTLSPSFSDYNSAAIASSASTPDCRSAVLKSVSTPSIGFENSTSASFPTPALFSGELSSIQQSHVASDLACYTPDAADNSSNPCPQHSSFIKSLSEGQLSSTSSLLAPLDLVPSNSSPSWTPDPTESFNPPAGFPEHPVTSFQLPPKGSQTSSDELITSFGRDQREPLSSRSKHQAARVLPERLLIRPSDASRVMQTSLTPSLSPLCEDGEYFLPSPNFSPDPTNFRSHVAETTPELYPPLTPVTMSPIGPGLMDNSTSSFWFQSNHFAHLNQIARYSEYDNNTNPPTFFSQSFSPSCDSVTHSSRVLNSRCPTRSASPIQFSLPLMVDRNSENKDSLHGESERVFMKSVSNWNDQPISKPYKKKKREVREVDAVCGACGERIARLTLRGSSEELHVDDGFELVHTCKLCQEGRPSGASLVEYPVSFLAPFSSRNFLNNNVKCQQLELLYPEPIPRSAMTTLRKRNRRTDDVTAPTTCDCCSQYLGIGGILPRNGRSAIQFVVEVVCIYCINNFRRCTDCGGGGGSRLGVGKWRCKELFSEGRRTCMLSHQRQGASTDVISTVWKVKEISDKPELETLVGQLRELVKHSLYAALATPEMLESGLARVKRFDDIEIMYANGWKRIEPLIREDIESSSGRRRYLGLRWTKPHPRKGPKRVNTMSDKWKPTAVGNDVVLQPGKELSGFVMSEWDMQQGTFFISVAMPWQSGDALELTTGLANKSFVQAKSDRERLIDEMVSRGLSRREANLFYPPIRHLWTLLFFHRDARLVQFLEKRRKFMPLEEYLTLYPDARRDFFPPERDCYVPADQQQGWNVWIRRENGDEYTSQK